MAERKVNRIKIEVNKDDFLKFFLSLFLAHDTGYEFCVTSLRETRNLKSSLFLTERRAFLHVWLLSSESVYPKSMSLTLSTKLSSQTRLKTHQCVESELALPLFPIFKTVKIFCLKCQLQ